MNELKSLSEMIPEETKKEIYEDALKPSMQETGKTISILPRVVKNALAKVEMWCINREFMVKEFELELQKKLESKKEENIVDADPSILVPSAQAISYTWDKEEIRQLYLNLMASDMDKTTKYNIHPSFVELIKQMDSVDVKIFTKLYQRSIYPVYSLSKKEDNSSGETTILDYLLSDNFYSGLSERQVIKSLNNLERLKLIEIRMDESFTDKRNYTIIEKGQGIQKYKGEFGESLSVQEGIIKNTEYGKSFFEVCCK